MFYKDRCVIPNDLILIVWYVGILTRGILVIWNKPSAQVNTELFCLFICFFEYDRKNNCGRIMVWFYCRHLSVDTVGFRAITLVLVDWTFWIFNTRSLH